MKQNSEKGFTLVELLVASVVFVIMVMMAGAILSAGQDHARLAGGKIDLEEATRESLYKMGLEIRQSSPDHFTIAEDGNSLDFQIPESVDDAGTITWSSTITYQIGGNGTQLVRFDSGTDETTVLANDIQTLEFSSLNDNTIQFDVTAQRELVDGRVLSVSSTGEARFRNA